MHHFEKMSSAYGSFACRPHRGAAPGPCWGTSDLQTPHCPPLKKSWNSHCKYVLPQCNHCIVSCHIWLFMHVCCLNFKVSASVSVISIILGMFPMNHKISPLKIWDASLHGNSCEHPSIGATKRVREGMKVEMKGKRTPSDFRILR